MLGLENLIPKFGMDGTTSGPIFLLVRRANTADFMYSNFVSVSSRRLDGRVFYAFTSVHYLVHFKNGLLFFFFFLFFTLVSGYYCYLFVGFPHSRYSSICIPCRWTCICPIVVPLFIPRGTEKHNLCRMRFKSYFVPLVLSSFSDSLPFMLS